MAIASPPVEFERPTGCQHELAARADRVRWVYISDPNRTAPSRLRTLLRQPVERIEDGGTYVRANQ
jgi:hypothetical protein